MNTVSISALKAYWRAIRLLGRGHDIDLHRAGREDGRALGLRREEVQRDTRALVDLKIDTAKQR